MMIMEETDRRRRHHMAWCVGDVELGPPPSLEAKVAIAVTATGLPRFDLVFDFYGKRIVWKETGEVVTLVE